MEDARPGRANVINYQSGDVVAYIKTKFSAKPGPRARHVEPARNGDTYRYQVEKYWVIIGSLSDEQLIVRTPGGKEQTVLVGDPNLRHVHWWEKLLHRDRFACLREQFDSVSSIEKRSA